jgi:hypothetical protein
MDVKYLIEAQERRKKKNVYFLTKIEGKHQLQSVETKKAFLSRPATYLPYADKQSIFFTTTGLEIKNRDLSQGHWFRISEGAAKPCFFGF